MSVDFFIQIVNRRGKLTIGSDGSLTGYGGGIERKRWLLGHESGHANHLAIETIRY